MSKPWVEEIDQSDVDDAESKLHYIQFGEEVITVDGAMFMEREDVDKVFAECLGALTQFFHSKDKEMIKEAVYTSERCRIINFRLH